MGFKNLFYILFHIGDYLQTIAQHYGLVCYIIIFVILFCETGLVVTPFLPGDSLLFTIGVLAAKGVFQIGFIILITGLAAITGDTLNYFIGRFLGKKLFSKEKAFLFNKKYLLKTESFYQKHGRKTIIITRFIPVLRTFAPFIAGMGRMKYRRFLTYNIAGGFGWVLILCLGGYFFGNLPVIRDNFSLVLTGIIIVSLVPVAVTIIKAVFSKIRT